MIYKSQKGKKRKENGLYTVVCSPMISQLYLDKGLNSSIYLFELTSLERMLQMIGIIYSFRMFQC